MQLGIRQKSAAASPLAIFVHQHLNSLRMSSQNFAHRSPPPGSSRSMIGRGHRFSSGLDGVRWELGQVLDDISTEEGVVGDVVLVQERSLGWLDADVYSCWPRWRLLGQLQPQVPHPRRCRRSAWSLPMTWGRPGSCVYSLRREGCSLISSMESTSLAQYCIDDSSYDQ